METLLNLQIERDKENFQSENREIYVVEARFNLHCCKLFKLWLKHCLQHKNTCDVVVFFMTKFVSISIHVTCPWVFVVLPNIGCCEFDQKQARQNDDRNSWHIRKTASCASNCRLNQLQMRFTFCAERKEYTSLKFRHSNDFATKPIEIMRKNTIKQNVRKHHRTPSTTRSEREW